MPDHSEWNTTQSGWTKYVYEQGGASFNEPIPYPIHDGQTEDAIVFDVETMPKEGHPYPVIAIVASPNAWYAWISPWLLGEPSSPAHLIPLGDPDKERLVVGHNVSFDRPRVEEEYSIGGTKTRWADTMSLHVAVNEISSHQRPAWKKEGKGREWRGTKRWRW
jgi:DNA polymerase gamma 1